MPRPDDPDVLRGREVLEALNPWGEPLPATQPGDWLAQHEEAGQTFAEYVESAPPLPVGERRVLYVVPLGPFSLPEEQIFDASCEHLALYFGLRVEALAPLSFDGAPDGALRAEGRGFGPQIHSWWILSRLLAPRLPADGAALIGLTARDLWPGSGWNFVFGQADLKKRVGVWSLARFGDPGESPAARGLALRRAVKVATHETGHMFGMQHCTAWRCNMNGSNHQAESDAQPLHLCPECSAKLAWGVGADMTLRATQLANFAVARGLPEAEVAYWTMAAQRLRR